MDFNLVITLAFICLITLLFNLGLQQFGFNFVKPKPHKYGIGLFALMMGFLLLYVGNYFDFNLAITLAYNFDCIIFGYNLGLIILNLSLEGIDPFVLAAIIPIKTYSNAEADKKKIFSENKKKSGIYSWTNLINGKKYIGSAIDLKKRLEKYYSTTYMEDALKRSNSHIYRALLKNGYSNFSLIILEYCEPEKCIEREDYYFSCFPHEYNILEKAGSWLGHKHSDETKTIMSDAKKGITGENHPRFGKNHTEETKRIMSEAKKGKPKVEGSGSPSKQIEVSDIKNNTITSYDSMSEAARALNIYPAHIIMYFKQNQKKPYKGQYTFKKL